MFCLMSWCFLFLCMVFLSMSLLPVQWRSHMPWIVKGALQCGFEFASEDLLDFPSLRVVFMLISWFGFKRNPNKVVIIWTVILLPPSILPFLRCLSPLATVNCPQCHSSTYTLMFCCIWLAWVSTGSVVLHLIFSLNMPDATTEQFATKLYLH